MTHQFPTTSSAWLSSLSSRPFAPTDCLVSSIRYLYKVSCPELTFETYLPKQNKKSWSSFKFHISVKDNPALLASLDKNLGVFINVFLSQSTIMIIYRSMFKFPSCFTTSTVPLLSKAQSPVSEVLRADLSMPSDWAFITR